MQEIGGGSQLHTILLWRQLIRKSHLSQAQKRGSTKGVTLAMADEVIPSAAHPDLRRRTLFPDGTEVVAAITDVDEFVGQYSPGYTIDFKSILPRLGYSLRHTSFLSTRKKDGSYYVSPGSSLDQLQQAALTDIEFFVNSKVDIDRLVGRLVAFTTEVHEYESEDGNIRRVNRIVEDSIQKPTEAELEKIGSTRLGAAILKRTAAAEEAAIAALEAPSGAGNGNQKALVAMPDVVEDDVDSDDDLDQLPF
jgi:hypothetical protein